MIPTMVQDFIDSWPLFHDSYLVGWLSLLLLAMVGVTVVARDQIFIGAAVSQASTLGLAIALSIADLPAFQDAEWLRSEFTFAVAAVAFSVLAALITSGSGLRPNTSEAVTGWVFLFSSSLSVLVVSHSPHGMEEVHRLISSGIYGATEGEVWLFAALAVAVGAFLVVGRRRALLVLTDEETARAVGIRVGAWRIGLACLLGLVVGLSLRSVGALYTFGCLVLPPLAARNLCRRLFPMLVVGPLLGLGVGIVAFVLANAYNQPPGQATVALLSVTAAACYGIRRIAIRE
jgi:ABC-type Mn2+/Zn2+ transport system permease subunit